MTDCPSCVWCHGLTTCLLYVMSSIWRPSFKQQLVCKCDKVEKFFRCFCFCLSICICIYKQLNVLCYVDILSISCITFTFLIFFCQVPSFPFFINVVLTISITQCLPRWAQNEASWGIPSAVNDPIFSSPQTQQYWSCFTANPTQRGRPGMEQNVAHSMIVPECVAWLSHL